MFGIIFASMASITQFLVILAPFIRKLSLLTTLVGSKSHRDALAGKSQFMSVRNLPSNVNHAPALNSVSVIPALSHLTIDVDILKPLKEFLNSSVGVPPNLPVPSSRNCLYQSMYPSDVHPLKLTLLSSMACVPSESVIANTLDHVPGISKETSVHNKSPLPPTGLVKRS